MPLVAHTALPAFDRLRAEGIRVLAPNTALHQDIRELHIGLLNMMPDAALEATERQFLRLVGESNPIAQFYLHPFTLDGLKRGPKAQAHIDQFYETFDSIRSQGLDGLIITGANVIGTELSNQPFWEPLIEVANWAHQHVTSTICSCLATHATLQFRFNQKRQPLAQKCWGVYPHRVVDPSHPLVNDINSRFDVPHSRWNAISADQFQQAGLRVLVQGEGGMVHLATSADGIRTVFLQGHPEYDTISLLKEYKRDVMLFESGEAKHPPPFPENYLSRHSQALLNEYGYRQGSSLAPGFPEELVAPQLDNTWHDTAVEVVGNWMGIIYQLTHRDRKRPFMDGIDVDHPLQQLQTQ